MPNRDASSIQTRPSLLSRLKSGDQTSSWQEFYQLYGKVVRDFALRAGLTDTEADEVVQETAIAVVRHLPDFKYNPAVCRFKTWLLNQSAWRVKDQLRKRHRAERLVGAPPAAGPNGTSGSGDETARTSAIERVPDPASLRLNELFEAEWRHHLFEVALEGVKARFGLKQLQIFDLTALKEWPARDVANALGVSLANVYVTRHRIASAIKKEAAKLERELNSNLSSPTAPTAPTAGGEGC